MPAPTWLCPSCAMAEHRPYQLPEVADVRCAGCSAPLTSDDVEVGLGLVPATITRFAVEREPDPVPSELEELLRGLREDVRRIGAAVAQLKTAAIMPAKVAVSVSEAAELLGCGRTQVFKYLSEGKLRRGKRLGRRATVTVASIEALLAGTATPPQAVTPRRSGAPSRKGSGTAILALSLTGTRARN